MRPLAVKCVCIVDQVEYLVTQVQKVNYRKQICLKQTSIEKMGKAYFCQTENSVAE